MNKTDLAKYLLDRGYGSTLKESRGILNIVLEALSETLEDVDIELDGFGNFIVDREGIVQFFADYELMKSVFAEERNPDDIDL